MASAQPAASDRARERSRRRSHARQHEQRDEEGEPVVVDLAVAHRHDHPLEVQHRHQPAGDRASTVADRATAATARPATRDHLEDLDPRTGRGQREQPADPQRHVQLGRHLRVPSYPRRREQGRHGDEQVTTREQDGDAGEGAGVSRPAQRPSAQDATTRSVVAPVGRLSRSLEALLD
jgi:hypothetical protein